MGDELSSYKLEWVVTSSSPVVQFRAEWKMIAKKAEWQSEIVEVRENNLSTPFYGYFPLWVPLICGYFFMGTF